MLQLFYVILKRCCNYAGAFLFKKKSEQKEMEGKISNRVFN